MTRQTSLAALLVLIAAPALAYEHTGFVVAGEDRPLKVSVEVDPAVDGLTREQILAEVADGLAMWSTPLCGFDAELLGEVAYEDPTSAPETQLHLVFESLGDGGPMAFRLGNSPENEPVFERGSETYYRAKPGAWVINTDYRWTTRQAIMEGGCADAYSLSSIVGKLVGFSAGVQIQVGSRSVMGSQLLSCEHATPNVDDLAGMDELYGPWVGISCTSDQTEPGSEEVSGVVPFDIRCHVLADGETTVSSASWTFGDGNKQEGGLNAENPLIHTYTADDNYTVRLTAVAEHPTCPAGERTVERFNYVRACDLPKPAMRLEREAGLRFRLVNQSDVRTYGCHNDVRWAIYTEDGQPVLEETSWEPLIELPEDGVYRIDLTLSGLAGEATVEELLDTRKGNVQGYDVGTGCSSVATSAWLPLPLLGLLLVARRRR